jgi:hypothetical protein
MPDIAAAVEKFSSEKIQAQVLQALMHAIGAEISEDGVIPNDDASTEDASTPDKANAKKAAAKAKKRQTPPKNSGKAKQTFAIDKNLDLVSGGAKPFKVFVAEKNPSSAPEKCLISVYWLTRLAKKPVPATIDQVYTCFKSAGWPVPSDLRNTVQKAGSQGWLDSKKGDDLRVVIGGENHVDHDMPVKKARSAEK